MNKTLIVKAAALAAIAAAFSAPAAAQTATLNVKGKLSPGACAVSFVGGGNIDYGNILSSRLSSTAYLPLTTYNKTLQVVCGADIQTAVSVTDNRSPSAIRDVNMKTLLGSATLNDAQVFGLGKSGTSNIGAYTVTIGRGTVTPLGGTATQQAAVLSSTNKTAWTASTTPVIVASGSAQFYSAGTTGTTPTPALGSTFSFPVTVMAALNNNTALPVSAEVPLDGSATFEITYM